MLARIKEVVSSRIKNVRQSVNCKATYEIKCSRPQFTMEQPIDYHIWRKIRTPYLRPYLFLRRYVVKIGKRGQLKSDEFSKSLPSELYGG